MVIHRTDKELIPPARPSDESARVVMDRRPTNQLSQGHGHPSHPTPEEEEDGAETQLGTTLYDPEGHLEEHEAAGAEPHQIDFTA